jgi:alanine racemase
MPADNRPTRAYIHLDNVLANYRLAERLARGKSVMAVVKSDAYGHGALPVARMLQHEGCRWFGVATLGEAIELREGGITGEVLLMGGLFPGDEEDAVRNGITCTVYDPDVAARLQKSAHALGEQATIHLKVDTGMSRIGFDVQGFAAFVRTLDQYPALSVRGLYSHLAESDKLDGVVTAEQGRLLESVGHTLRTALGELPHLHLGNSAALMLQKDLPGDLVRPGVMLYGGYPMVRENSTVALSPAMTLRSALVQVRRIETGRRVGYSGTWTAQRGSVIGVVPIGYGDGVPRLLSNRGEVVVGGRRVPIVGRVCMDWIMVDLTDLQEPRVGQSVTLLGGEGGVEVTAEDWSAWAETIPYEIFCSIAPRVPRAYVGRGEA